MRLYSYLYKNRFGIYYLRIQKNGIDRRISLRTRDPDVARVHSYEFGANISRMSTKNKLSQWDAKVNPDGTIEITDIKSAEDAQSAQDYTLAVMQQMDKYRQQDVSSHLQPRMKFRTALFEYLVLHSAEQSLDDSTDTKKKLYAYKTLKMDTKVLNELSDRLDDIYLHELTDKLVFEKWLKHRMDEVKNATVKRELTSIKKFVNWCCEPAREYMNKKLSLTVKVNRKDVEHREYLEQQDVMLIINNLHTIEEAWHFWVVLIAMYTGARAGEIGEMRVNDFKVVNGVNTVYIEGPKTEASQRTIPVHPVLIEIGLLEYVMRRREIKAEMLFPISYSKSNGWGAQPSKFFSGYKQRIGLTDKLKTLQSFRSTVIDLLKQAEVTYEKRCQYVGHEPYSSIHSRVYARGKFSHISMKNGVVDLIDWSIYYESFEMNIEHLKAVAKKLLVKVR